MRKILPHKGPSVLFYVEQNHIECQIPQIASHKAANDSNIQNFHNANNRAAHLAHFFLDPLNIFPPVACISFRFHANSSEIPVQNPNLNCVRSDGFITKNCRACPANPSVHVTETD